MFNIVTVIRQQDLVLFVHMGNASGWVGEEEWLAGGRVPPREFSNEEYNKQHLSSLLPVH